MNKFKLYQLAIATTVIIGLIALAYVTMYLQEPKPEGFSLGTSQSSENRTIKNTNAVIELVAVDGDCKLFRIKQDGVGSRYVYWSICTNGRNSALTTTNY